MKQQKKPFADGNSKIVPRFGKTEKDRKSGKHRRAVDNRNKRVDWQQHGGVFPAAACNGKDNRYSFAKSAKHSNPAKGADFRAKKTHASRSAT